MPTVQIEKTIVQAEKQQKCWEEWKGIKGLIQWNVIHRADTMKKRLVISTFEDYDEIVLNGKIINSRNA